MHINIFFNEKHDNFENVSVFHLKFCKKITKMCFFSMFDFKIHEKGQKCKKKRKKSKKEAKMHFTVSKFIQKKAIA